MSWGRFPDQVVGRLRKLEWDNSVNLRRRLLGERGFPIELNLKPPSGAQALLDLDRLRGWLDAWRAWPAQSQIQYQHRNYRQIGSHHVPVRLRLASMQDLIECLGPPCIERSRRWERVMQPLLSLDGALYPVLVQNLPALEGLTAEEADRLAGVLPQLQAEMGQGNYLRALPVRGVDTKFIETHEALVTALLDALHGGGVSAAGGLRCWLGCRANPGGLLYVRALGAAARKRLAGLAIICVPAQELLTTALPAARILVVENVQSGLALPELEDTMAVFGGGQNLAWMRAAWLARKRVGYWGDIDTWGLKFLGDARQSGATIDALMMDIATLERFFDRTVFEPQPWRHDLPGLLPQEQALYRRLWTSGERALRLEQERLDADYVRACLQNWVKP